MPIGHSSLAGLRRRRLRPSLIGWGMAAAGAGLLAAGALSLDPTDIALLALAGPVCGLVAWRSGRRAGLAMSLPVGLVYLLLEFWRGGLDATAALRGIPGFLTLPTLAVGLAEMGHIAEGLAQSSMLDQVTRLPNHTLFQRFLEIEVSRSMRYRLPFSLALLEVQDFDNFTRTHGYWQGDVLLSALAKTLAETLRRSDVLARVGGPQFALLLPMTTHDGALVALKRLESALQVSGLPNLRGAGLTAIALKTALAEFPADGQEASDILRLAGERLGGKRPALPTA